MAVHAARVLALLLSILVSAAPDAPEPAEPEGLPCKPLGPKQTLVVDLADARLIDVARVVSCALDRNFLFQPPTVGDKRVTFIGPRPLDRRALDALFDAVLAEHGLVTERHGAFDVIRVPN